MRKEILLAIVVGIIVGLGITFGLYLVRERFRPQQSLQQLTNLGNPEGTPSPIMEGTLTIQQPSDNLYTQNSTVRIVGRAEPNSYITILAAENEYLTTADQDGDFSQEIELIEGGNQVTVVATSTDGEQEEVVLSLVYSTIDIDATATPSGEEL